MKTTGSGSGSASGAASIAGSTATSSAIAAKISNSNNSSNSSLVPHHAHEEDSSALGFSEGSFDQSLDASTGTSGHHHHRSMDQTAAASLMNEDNSSDAQFPDGDGGNQPPAAKRMRM